MVKRHIFTKIFKNYLKKFKVLPTLKRLLFLCRIPLLNLITTPILVFAGFVKTMPRQPNFSKTNTATVKSINSSGNQNIASKTRHLAEETDPPAGGAFLKQFSDYYP